MEFWQWCLVCAIGVSVFGLGYFCGGVMAMRNDRRKVDREG